MLTGNPVLGQPFGSIDGEAKVVMGAAVAGVTVTVTDQGTNAIRSVLTNDAGVYSFPSMRLR